MEPEAARFMRCLRGHRSQIQLARRLGYRGNPITDWERGARFPTAGEALRVATLVGIDVSACCRRFAPTVRVEVGPDGQGLSDWLRALQAQTPIQDIASRSGKSRFAVRRWLLGEAKPRLPDFMRLLDALTGRLPEWCAEFVTIESMPTLQARLLSVQAAKRLAFEAPWTEAVLRLLETRAYRRLQRHRQGFVAECLGLTLEQERHCLEQLQRAGLIQRRSRKYAVTQRHTVDTQGGKEALRLLKRHWSQVSADRVVEAMPDDLFAYNVMSLSRADAARVREKLQEVFREIRMIVGASDPEEVVAICNLQLMLFDPEGV
jgi:transcriptional regulator with XRE-family HTH domain